MIVTERLTQRWPAMRVFVWAGVLCVIVGGLVSAVARPTGFEAGSWVAAYLVLVGGVAQIALGAGQALLAPESPRTATTTVEAALWNGGAGATILGTVLTAPALTTIGAFGTASALVAFVVAVRHHDGPYSTLAVIYRTTLVAVLLGLPVGVMLAWSRHG